MCKLLKYGVTVNQSLFSFPSELSIITSAQIRSICKSNKQKQTKLPTKKQLLQEKISYYFVVYKTIYIFTAVRLKDQSIFSVYRQECVERCLVLQSGRWQKMTVSLHFNSRLEVVNSNWKTDSDTLPIKSNCELKNKQFSRQQSIMYNSSHQQSQKPTCVRKTNQYNWLEILSLISLTVKPSHGEV